MAQTAREVVAFPTANAPKKAIVAVGFVLALSSFRCWLRFDGGLVFGQWLRFDVGFVLRMVSSLALGSFRCWLRLGVGFDIGIGWLGLSKKRYAGLFERDADGIRQGAPQREAFRSSETIEDPAGPSQESESS